MGPGTPPCWLTPAPQINVWYHLPEPAQFKGRFLATGGGGESINSGEVGLDQGVVEGAATGMTDGGFGSFNAAVTDVILKSNDTLNEAALTSFAYAGIHEMSIIGKQLAKNFYRADTLYSYYFGCSEGGREGFSQVQRYADQFDGVVVGAPAFRQAFQQPNHLTSGVIETTLNYFPSACELEKINNDTIAACDEYDGKKDGVVSRTDLCKLLYDMAASIGQPFACPATQGHIAAGDYVGRGGGMGGTDPLFGGGGAMPAVNGTVSSEAVAVAKAIVAGLHDSDGGQVYVSYQPSATFDDARTVFNETSQQYYFTPPGISVSWVREFLQKVQSDSLPMNEVTEDQLRDWMLQGVQDYNDTMETTWPNLTDFRDAKGKILQYHGESDPSIPSMSSVMYQDSVRTTVYPDDGFFESFEKMNDWFRLFLVPGGGHCAPSPTQPNGPWPQRTLQTLFAWVEDDISPRFLNGTVMAGNEQGQQQHICPYPLRPFWVDQGREMECVFDFFSLPPWYPHLNGLPFGIS